ncbi:class I SAM-dependent methyltransferase [Antribacter gilvus]|uniref:class I SAM-dependent methyltransferase n=1 Tax=Antribacter gilvus TaxID=2304675 RepID=UPI000F7AFE4D|nr:class I SAM-dependent methyltransferase [Antribacter gilvus]
MSLYETAVDMSNRNSSQTLEAEFVGEGRTVLDVGCASGYLADALNVQGCKVSGIELDAEAAEIARPKLDKLVIGNLEEVALADAFAGSTFERIVFGDILEHLSDPAAVLTSALEILTDDGEIIISVPNVAHGSLRLALMQGRWNYTPTGLLDNTHIRFFTYEGLVDMLASVGLVVREAWSTSLDPLGTEVAVSAEDLPDGVVDWVRHQPRALDYQYVVRASRGKPDGPPPEVQPAVPAEECRFDDIYAHRAHAAAEEAHRALVSRDNIIGLESQIARLEKDLEKARSEANEVHAQLALAAEDRQAVYRSATWRAGRLVLTPLNVVKRNRG